MLLNIKKYRLGRIVYNLDDNERTAMVCSLRIGRCRRWRIPESVVVDGLKYVVEGIDIGVGGGNRHLQRLVIPDTVWYVDEDCFAYCPNLRYVYVGTSVRYLCSWHFRNHGKVNINIDAANRYIRRNGPFILSNGGMVLNRVASQREHYRIPEGVRYIDQISMWDNLKVKSITFPHTLRFVGSSAFENCPNLRRVVLPEGLKEVRSSAFDSCERLEYVDLPSTLVAMDSGILNGCRYVKTLIVRSAFCIFPPGRLGLESSGCTIFVHARFVDAYRLLSNGRWRVEAIEGTGKDDEVIKLHDYASAVDMKDFFYVEPGVSGLCDGLYLGATYSVYDYGCNVLACDRTGGYVPVSVVYDNMSVIKKRAGQSAIEVADINGVWSFIGRYRSELIDYDYGRITKDELLRLIMKH